jgi:lipoyl(octanoyl) transferase
MVIRELGLRDYVETWRSMQAFTADRGAASPDEIWLLQHTPVYTLGLSGRREHLHGDTCGIPVVHSDRGGQVTYHGPGQLVAYVLLDLSRARRGVKSLVHLMEQAIVDVLVDYRVAAQRRAGAPGVYVGQAKIAALGLRVRRGCSYHGLALNVDMDLAPFGRIDPCGYRGLEVIDMRRCGARANCGEVGERLVQALRRELARRPETTENHSLPAAPCLM